MAWGPIGHPHSTAFGDQQLTPGNEGARLRDLPKLNRAHLTREKKIPRGDITSRIWQPVRVAVTYISLTRSHMGVPCLEK